MKRLTSSIAFGIFILMVSSIVVLLATNFYLASSAASRREAITLRGHASLNFQNGRSLSARYHSTNAGILKALKQGQAQALSLAADDLNQDGFPDVVGGYTSAGEGLLALHFGNPEAFSPTQAETLQAVASGRFSDPFLTDAVVLALPAAPDFLATGDFNRDGRPDILTGVRGGTALYLLAGDENHNFEPASALALPGNLTALAVAPKSEMSLAVAIDGTDGASILVYDARRDIFDQQPLARALPASVTALAPGRLDEDRSTDLAIIAGSQLYLLHGQANKSASGLVPPDRQAGQLEPIALPFGVKAVAVSDFIWDRDARLELAVAAHDGVVHLLARGVVDTRPLAASEVLERRQLVAQVRRGERRWADLATPPTEQAMNWAVAETTALSISNADGGAQGLLLDTLASGRQAHDLLVLNPSANQMQIAFKAEAQAGREAVTFDLGAEPVAALPVRLNVLGRPGLVVLRRGQVVPAFVMLAPASTYAVNHAGDTDDAAPGDNNCADAGGNCSLRAAVQEANAHTGADMITFAAGLNGTPIQLTQVGDDNNAGNGDLDINDSLTIVGNGAANTILQGSADAAFSGNVGDKLFGINQDGINSTLNVSLSGLTIRFTKNANPVGTFTETGGALDVFLTGTGATPGPTVT
jgi:CSLREA domain-containing protein